MEGEGRKERREEGKSRRMGKGNGGEGKEETNLPLQILDPPLLLNFKCKQRHPCFSDFVAIVFCQ